MPSELEVSIYRTLAYFAYFKYPLTSFEIWKWLLEPDQPTSLVSIIETLENSIWLRARLKRDKGFYALENVAERRKDRHLRFLDAMRKYRKAERAVQVLGRLPWIEGIAVCNSLSWYQTKEDSDIDLFIVAKPGRIWSARLLSTLPAIFLRQRPGEAKSDPICLSFFSTAAALQFEKLKIGPSDPYLAYWCRSLVPLVDHSGWMEKFEMANPWLRQVLPNAQFVRRASRFRPPIRLRLPWIPLSEQLPRQIQQERFTPIIRELMNKDSRVVVSDDMLKFHEQDSRELIRSTLADKIADV
ncbi:MAG: hypothetical protein AAB776_04545 [Patescibacteria group bacterium]